MAIFYSYELAIYEPINLPYTCARPRLAPGREPRQLSVSHRGGGRENEIWRGGVAVRWSFFLKEDEWWSICKYWWYISYIYIYIIYIYHIYIYHIYIHIYICSNIIYIYTWYIHYELVILNLENVWFIDKYGSARGKSDFSPHPTAPEVKAREMWAKHKRHGALGP